MIKVKEDLTGRIFGRLTVIKQIEDHVCSDGRHRACWRCKCECGNYIDVIGYSLTRKRYPTKSCGCWVREIINKTNTVFNKYDLSGEFGIGYCLNTNTKFYFDLDDYDLIKGYYWQEYTNNKGYHSVRAYIRSEKRFIKMHRLLVEWQLVDHINRNPLDNRRDNLRRATIQKNNWNKSKQKNNTSGVSGVSWHKQKQNWSASISCDKKQYHLGYFINKNDAIRARLNAEVKYFGEFAPQKHLFKEYGIETIQND